MDKSSTHCVMPHLGMAIQNHADFCCCNLNKASWQNNQREVIHVYSHSVKNVYQSHTRKIIAAALDHGIQHASCQTCWDLEAAGGQSQRQTLNQLFGDTEPRPDQPRVLIIKPGNTCNLACRMCNPITSSSWYADAMALQQAGLASASWYENDQAPDVTALTYNEYTRTFETVRNSFNRDNEDFWTTLKQWIENLVYIDIYGGEPFLTPAMFDLLEHGVSLGASQHIKINIHTNATIFNQRYLKILSQYQHVKFHVSLDSHDPAQLEYIRYKSSFETVQQNVLKFRDFVEQHNNIDMDIMFTVTPLNVFYVDQSMQALATKFNLPISVNIVTTPEYDIRHLPEPVKKMLASQTQTALIKKFLQQQIPGCDIEWPRFCQATDLLDGLRNQSFAVVFPEWWQILKPYWIKK